MSSGHLASVCISLVALLLSKFLIFVKSRVPWYLRLGGKRVIQPPFSARGKSC